MKKLFTVFCAVCLMPTFSAQAWIGGPFSNNSFFGENGDDGVYEAAATAVNGIGLYRIVVGNNFNGVNPTGVTTSSPGTTGFVSGVVVIPTSPIASGNTVVGAIGSNFGNVWYIAGIFYAGTCLGTASSVLGIVQGFGEARNNRGTGGLFLSSQFTAAFQGSGRFLPARSFNGTGSGQITAAFALPAGVPAGEFFFTVIGSKVSSRITFGL